MVKLSAGAASTVITPAVGSYMSAWGLRRGRSIGVHDDEKARAVVLDDGNERLAIVALDVSILYESLTADIRRRVRALTGIRESNVMVCASHTHTSPQLGAEISIWEERGDSQYTKVFPEYVAGTVAAADHLLRPAKVSSSSSELAGITVNRRHPERRVDTRLSVLKIEDGSGKVISEVINFACHPVIVGGQYLLWSADFPGAACSFVEEAIPGCVCLYINGAAGDVHPWDMWFGNDHPKHPNTHEEAEKFGRVLGSEAIRLAETGARHPAAVELRSRTKHLKLKMRKIPSEDEAQRVLDEILAHHKPWTKDTWDPGDTISNIFMRHPSQYLIACARQTLALSRSRNSDISAEMQAFGLGDTALVSIPGEPFSELGIELRAGSKARETFMMGYANDDIGYIPTVEAITECEKLGLEEGFGLKYTYGATLPVTRISKKGVTKLVSSAIEMANLVTSS